MSGMRYEFINKLAVIVNRHFLMTETAGQNFINFTLTGTLNNIFYKNMNALVFNEKGKAEEVLTLSRVNLETLQQNEIKIQTIASPINPNDFMFIEKQYRLVPVFPQVAGFEGCGYIIDNNGDTNFPVGSLVSFRHKNVWAEQVNVPKEKLILLPANFPIEKAAQLWLNPLTAWALIEKSEAKPGEWIIISAGASTVSKLIIQFARQKGIKTIVVVRDNKQTDELKSLGANVVITDTNLDEIANRITAEINNEFVKCFVDAVGGELTTKIIPTLSTNGKIICYGLLSSNNVSFHNSTVIFKLLSITGFGIDNWIANKSEIELNVIWEQIIKQVGNNNFKMNVAETFPLTDHKNAITKSKTKTNGKILFYINQD